jgi:hypothetical protein
VLAPPTDVDAEKGSWRWGVVCSRVSRGERQEGGREGEGSPSERARQTCYPGCASSRLWLTGGVARGLLRERGRVGMVQVESGLRWRTGGCLREGGRRRVILRVRLVGLRVGEEGFRTGNCDALLPWRLEGVAVELPCGRVRRWDWK